MNTALNKNVDVLVSEKPQSADLYTSNMAGERPTDTSRCPSGINPRTYVRIHFLFSNKQARNIESQLLDDTMDDTLALLEFIIYPYSDVRHRRTYMRNLYADSDRGWQFK